ncbi:unnamed protein product [Phytomonas sp. Hart1]|nr:unnamed protein product [Phytomonas sp. Hart1]|eukprot:CCW68073.1 unnamed protein product [Phytomonas sp. isolate Hart1]
MPHRIAPANVQTAVVYLLDMLNRDADVAILPSHRIFQSVLELLLPAFVSANLQLCFIILFSLQSAMSSPRRRYDVELLGLWRTRVLDELGSDQLRAMCEATLNFFTSLDTFCLQSSAVSNQMLVRWIRSYCWDGANSTTAFARTRTRVQVGRRASLNEPFSMHTPFPPSFATSSLSSAVAPVFLNLPFPILNPFKPWIELHSVLLTSIRVESLSSSKPIWITFSNYSDAERANRKETRKGNSARESEKDEMFFSFLYKRESALRDQLMCISSRLLQWLLRNQIGSRVKIGNYSVLPLSDSSALIESLEGYTLYKLPGIANGNLALVTYLTQRGEAALLNFLASAKLFLLLNYIFSIGDRHQGNVMMSPVGAILHIDFSYIFSEKTLMEKLAGTSIRVDSQLLSAVAFCRRATTNTTASCPHLADDALSSSSSSLFLGSPCEGFLEVLNDSADDRHRNTMMVGDPARPTNDNSFQSDNEEFFTEAAEWFLRVRPHAALFYELWRYAVRCQSLPFDERNLATIFNTLFDRSASRKSSADSFMRAMEHSINVCRLKDATYSSVQTFRSYTDQVVRYVSETPLEARKLLDYVWNHFNLSRVA